MLVQIAKKIGAGVIATVSMDEKAKMARETGVDEVILYSEQDFEAETKRLTGGKGAEVVYDGVGKATFSKGLNCLKPRGIMVYRSNVPAQGSQIGPVLHGGARHEGEGADLAMNFNIQFV